ncbi:MAG: hypothetical protein H7Y43_18195, partial [Akkermansiaceae bacterium]|nr:hypothetical protein [Verrucomicrobiales bacterium]
MNRQRFLVFAFVVLVAIGGSSTYGGVEAQVAALESRGQFREAGQVLSGALTDAALGETERKQLAFELDRLERIRKDYPLTKGKLFGALQEAVRDLTEREFEGWIAEGRFDTREIDGERRFMGSSVNNLFFRHAELSARLLPPKDTAKHDLANWETCVSIKQAARKE